ncbi:MAG: exopolysaccharide Pel transporter PelG, partial [Planctomycetota bacterium]|nr:exopolysaccharide Pel transporter PelG [Planctomycetota bacterium]
MAGIGFRLQHLLRPGTYRGIAAAYCYAAFITAGPWLLSIGALQILALAASWCEISRHDALIFRTIVIYTYAGTLILTGLIQMGTTRYVADRLYVNDTLALAPCYQWTAIGVALVSGLLASIFYAHSSMGITISLAAIALFQSVAINWLGMVFLSA